MLEAIVIGGGFAFAAAVQPGPLQAFLISRVVSTGWKRTVPACFAPVISDGPVALIAILVLHQLPPRFQHGLRAAGGLVLMYLAWEAFRQWRRPAAAAEAVSSQRTLLEAVIVNITNPNAYIGWTLVLGPALLAAWHEHPINGVVLVATFYGVMISMLVLFVMLVGTARFLGARGQNALVGVSALVLAGLAVWLLVAGVRGFTAAGVAAV